jgi:hypothetical protein
MNISDDGCTLLKVVNSDLTKSKSIKIGPKITHIGPGAFEGCEIQSISIHAGIKVIGSGAFKDCSNLRFVDFIKGRNSITIDSLAFANCKKLIKPNPYKGLTQESIADDAFEGCTFTGVTEKTAPEDIGCAKVREQARAAEARVAKAADTPIDYAEIRAQVRAVEAKITVKATVKKPVEAPKTRRSVEAKAADISIEAKAAKAAGAKAAKAAKALDIFREACLARDQNKAAAKMTADEAEKKKAKAKELKAKRFKSAIGKKPQVGSTVTSILGDTLIGSIKEEEHSTDHNSEVHTLYPKTHSFFTKNTTTAAQKESSVSSDLGNSWQLDMK